MPYLLDSNAWITWLRKAHAPLVARVRHEAAADIYLCSVVVGELIYGAQRSGAAHVVRNMLNVEHLQNRFVSLPFDDRAAEEYGHLRAYLTSLGLMIGGNDAQIASIALAHNLTLVTHNTTEFQRVPSLTLEDWQLP